MPVAAAAMPVHLEQQVESGSANRLQVLVRASAESREQRVAVAERPDHDLMAYRIRVEPAEPAGPVVSASAPWQVSLLVGNAEQHTVVQLRPDLREVSFPRPLGVHLGASDSVLVVLTVGENEPAAVALKVSIEFEPVGSAASRLAVLPVSASPRIAATSAAAWDWTPTQSGRVLAIAGLPLDQVVSISLADIASGEVLWSNSVNAATPGALGSPGSVVRLGVPVERGRTYRLSVTFVGELSTPRAMGGVLAMVLPSGEAR